MVVVDSGPCRTVAFRLHSLGRHTRRGTILNYTNWSAIRLCTFIEPPTDDAKTVTKRASDYY